MWVVESGTNTASLKPVTIAGYETGAVTIESGLEPGELIVVDGGKLLSSGQPVAYEEDPS